MSETLKPSEVRQRLGDLLDRVADRRDDFVIERRGKPLAALVPFEKYRRLQKAAELEFLRGFDEEARRLTQLQAKELAKRVRRRDS